MPIHDTNAPRYCYHCGGKAWWKAVLKNGVDLTGRVRWVCTDCGRDVDVDVTADAAGGAPVGYVTGFGPARFLRFPC